MPFRPGWWYLRGPAVQRLVQATHHSKKWRPPEIGSPQGTATAQGHRSADQGNSRGAQQGQPPAAGRPAERRRRDLIAAHSLRVASTPGRDNRGFARHGREACAWGSLCATRPVLDHEGAWRWDTARPHEHLGGSSGRGGVGGRRRGPSPFWAESLRSAWHRGEQRQPLLTPRRAPAASPRAGAGRRPIRRGRRTGGRGPRRCRRCRDAPTACRRRSARGSSRR